MSILLTGLPASGKTSIAKELVRRMHAMRHRVTLLDADEFRCHIARELGFSATDREENFQRACIIAQEIVKHRGTVILAFVSAYERTRAELRRSIERFGIFYLVHVSTQVGECKERMLRDAPQRASHANPPDSGMLPDYEPPRCCEATIDTIGLNAIDAADKVILSLSSKATAAPHLRLFADLEVACPPGSSAQPDVPYDRVQLFQHLLETMREHRVALRAIARDLGISRHTIERTVRLMCGRNFRQLQNDILGQRARCLLHQGKSVKEIAFDLGFGSPQAFDRFIKRTCSKTPSLLR